MPKAAKKVEGVYEKNPGSGVWYVQYRMPSAPTAPHEIRKPGKLVRKRIGTRQQAIEYADKVRLLRSTGEGIVPDTATKPAQTFREAAAIAESITFGELADDLLRHIQANPREYKDQTNPPLRLAMMKRQFGHRAAVSIKPHEISDFLDSLGIAPATWNRYNTVISAVYVYAKQREKLDVNPARIVKRKRVSNGVIRFMTDDEEARIRAVLQSDVDACGDNERLKRRYMQHIYELDVALGTGMRRSNQYRLTWRDIDFDQRLITLVDTKNGDSQQVVMIDDVYTALKALQHIAAPRKSRSADRPNQSATDCVFALEDNKNWWLSACKRAKVKKLRWHDLRHTFCSRLAQAGVSLKVIQEAAGHKTIQMSARYAHLDRTTLKNALAVLNRKQVA